MTFENRVGIVGLGAMGSGIAVSFARNNKTIAAYDINPERVEQLSSYRIRSCESAEQLVQSCEIIVLSLPSSRVTVEVIESSVLPSIGNHQIVVDTGTTDVQETRRLAQLLRSSNAFLVDAPVSGGSISSVRGDLYCFVGGESTAVESCWKDIQTFASARATFCGESGSGQIAKYVNQLSMGLVSAAYLEAIAFGVKAGVSAPTLLNAVGGTEGFRDEFSKIAAMVIEGKADSLDHKSAEFGYFLDEADDSSFDAPILRALSSYLSSQNKTFTDNVGRPYASLWKALMASKREGNQ